MIEIDDRDLEILLAEDPAGPEPEIIRPNSAPAYYLGRPARLWITVMRPPAGKRRPPPGAVCDGVAADRRGHVPGRQGVGREHRPARDQVVRALVAGLEVLRRRVEGVG